MISLRRSLDRGHVNFGWLDTYHTFSFGAYHDAAHMGFSVLRVLNQDRVEPGKGFGTHPHRDMEILSYGLTGVLEHEDSMGNGSQVHPGEIQFMSAGSGVTHSEFNGSQDEVLEFLQMWILPAAKGGVPRYDQRCIFQPGETGLRPAASPDGRDDSIVVGQDALLYVGRLDGTEAVRHDLPPGRKGWLHVARGALDLNGNGLEAGDGAAIEGETELRLHARGSTEVVLFDLP